jgi:hypothetical protein
VHKLRHLIAVFIVTVLAAIGIGIGALTSQKLYGLWDQRRWQGASCLP